MKRKHPRQKLITDKDMRTVAQILATNGYEKDSGRKSGAITLAARTVNKAPKTIYEWLKKEDFVAAIEELIHHEIAGHISNLISASRKGNVTAAIYRLKVLNPEKFDDSLIRERAIQQIANQGLKDAAAAIPPLIVVSHTEVGEMPEALRKAIEQD